ncbi:hypothetical protein FQN54_002538 [Arachnomyces sp. PD_36]|nr:hypothetical protein FQN54_002538 [Arachnomyces sp. PD_36]
MSSTVIIADLGPEKAGAFVKVFTAVLNSPVATRTFAQIIDGLPVADTYDYSSTLRWDIRSRLEPSQNSTIQFRDMRSAIQIENIPIDAMVNYYNHTFPPYISSRPDIDYFQTAQAYQMVPLRSSAFNMHLLEIVAVAVHDLASRLYTMLHPNGEIPEDIPPDDSFPPLPTATPSSFYVYPYYLWQSYPRGVSDMVGYWAEKQIFGGVVLFDRGPNDDKNCHGAYIHYERENIFQLTDTQLQRFTRSATDTQGLHEDSGAPGLEIPLFPEPGTRIVTMFDSFSLNIYRDKYERVQPIRDTKPRCVFKREDDPERFAFMDEVIKRNSS